MRVAPAAAGELRHELERPLLGPEVRQREPGVRIDDRREVDAREVVALRDHLRPDQDGPLGPAEALERLPHGARPGGGVCVEPDALELRHVPLELLLEPLGARADVGELDRSARRAGVGHRLPVAAVVAVEAPVTMEGQRHVAVPAPSRDSAGAAVDRGRDPAPVEQEDRLAAVLGQPPELRQEGRRERVAALAPEVDEADTGQRGADPGREHEVLEARPALRSGRGAAVDRNGSLERRALRCHGARVVARIRLLLERAVVLLVDDDEPEPRDGREHGRARPDDDSGLSARNAIALVAPLCGAEGGVEDRDGIAEAIPEPSDRLGREGDLGHEDDRSEAALKSRLRRPEVDLGLAAPGRADEQEVSGVRGLDPGDDPRHGPILLGCEAGRCRLGGSDSRSAGDGRSPRGVRLRGATRASARAGVVP